MIHATRLIYARKDLKKQLNLPLHQLTIFLDPPQPSKLISLLNGDNQHLYWLNC